MKNFLTICILLYCSVTHAQLQFKSGASGFSNFLKEYIVYPGYSKQNCIQGTVTVSFKLDQKGNVYTSRITNGIISDLDNEALRLIRMSSGKWKLPIGYDTTTAVVMPINFKLTGDCLGKSKSEIRSAILAYQGEEGLMNAVTNFYKYRDKAKPGQEVEILAIKKQLGIDEEYLDDLVKTGLKKVKQKDLLGACEDFNLIKNLGSKKADEYLAKYCK